jgi:2'-5' RNA ligase
MTPDDDAQTVYAVALFLPPAAELEMHHWALHAPGATWDRAGGHITVLRVAGEVAEGRVVEAFEWVCGDTGQMPVRLCTAVREPYWGKPGLEIVMLTGERPEDTASIASFRERLLGAFEGLGLSLAEEGRFVPHVTLTQGLPADEAGVLVEAASGMRLEFLAESAVLWTDGGTGTWRLVGTRRFGGEE